MGSAAARPGGETTAAGSQVPAARRRTVATISGTPPGSVRTQAATAAPRALTATSGEWASPGSTDARSGGVHAASAGPALARRQASAATTRYRDGILGTVHRDACILVGFRGAGGGRGAG